MTAKVGLPLWIRRSTPATGSFDARAELPNADAALRPGQFVRVIVEGAMRPNTIVVPQRAVMDGPQGKFVFVTGKGGRTARPTSRCPVP